MKKYMNMELSLKEKEVILVLRDNDRDVDRVQWIDENDLLENFFPMCDMLLSRQGVAVDKIDDFTLVTDIPRGYTTARIAETIIKTFNFARKMQL